MCKPACIFASVSPRAAVTQPLLWPAARGETSFSHTHTLGFLLTLAPSLFCKAPDPADSTAELSRGLELEVSLLLGHIHVQSMLLSQHVEVPASDAASAVPIQLTCFFQPSSASRTGEVQLSDSSAVGPDGNESSAFIF